MRAVAPHDDVIVLGVRGMGSATVYHPAKRERQHRLLVGVEHCYYCSINQEQYHSLGGERRESPDGI